MVGSSLARKF